MYEHDDVMQQQQHEIEYHEIIHDLRKNWILSNSFAKIFGAIVSTNPNVTNYKQITKEHT